MPSREVIDLLPEKADLVGDAGPASSKSHTCSRPGMSTSACSGRRGKSTSNRTAMMAASSPGAFCANEFAAYGLAPPPGGSARALRLAREPRPPAARPRHGLAPPRAGVLFEMTVTGSGLRLFGLFSWSGGLFSADIPGLCMLLPYRETRNLRSMAIMPISMYSAV
jgi:hypothetical protein